MSPRLAFASTDGHRVNDHFGSAPRFHVFALEPDGPQHCAVIDCATGEGHDSGRLAERIDALKACRAVICTAIGQGALRQLRAAGVEAVRVPEGASVSTLLADWLTGRLGVGLKNMDGSSERFDKFLDEGWQE